MPLFSGRVGERVRAMLCDFHLERWCAESLLISGPEVVSLSAIFGTAERSGAYWFVFPDFYATLDRDNVNIRDTRGFRIERRLFISVFVSFLSSGFHLFSKQIFTCSKLSERKNIQYLLFFRFGEKGRESCNIVYDVWCIKWNRTNIRVLNF